MKEHPMERAVRLARGFSPHPNPRVGAVIVDASGQIVGEGAHERPGSAHAEVTALERAGGLAAGGAIYVTLEPCNHTGRTGPCTIAIINAGLRKVVVGALDPDTRVAGAGLSALREAGIDVVIDGTAAGLTDLDPGYFHHRETGRPRFTLKSALTLDGQVAALDQTSKWITGEEARLDGHLLRAGSDGVVVGAGTVLADDPRLDVRLPGYDGPQPRPIVITGARPIPDDAAVIGRNALVVSTGRVKQPGEALIVGPGVDGNPDLGEVAAALGSAGFIDVLIEGGPTLAGAMWAAGLVDHGVWHLAATVAGGTGYNVFSREFSTLADARKVEFVDVRRVGADLRVEFSMEG